jgi:hypothetical protein
MEWTLEIFVSYFLSIWLKEYPIYSASEQGWGILLALKNKHA